MTENGLTQAELFDVFSNARRRRTVRFLRRQNGSCDLAPLVEQVAAWENDVDPDDVTRAQRRRVYISLYQTHLPMLEDHGIVDWDADAHEIELLMDERTFDPYLDRGVGDGHPWHVAYASLSLVGAAALAFAVAPAGPLSAMSAPLVAIVVCAVTLAVAVAHHVSRRPGWGVPLALSRR